MKIEVNVSNKIARLVNREFVGVCGNSDYVIHFNFDSEWDSYDTKTARFKWGGSYTDVVFAGDEVAMPVMYNTNRVEIGVYAGNLHTTTSALLKMKKSILCGAGAPADPTPDVYDQLMELIKGLGGADPDDIAKAVADYLAAHPIEETDPTVPAWAKAETKPTYSAAEVGAIAQSDLQAATDAALAQAKSSGEFDGATGPAGPQGPAGAPGKDGAGMDITGATIVNKSGGGVYGWTLCRNNGIAWAAVKSYGAISELNLTPGSVSAPYNLTSGVGSATTLKLETPDSKYAPITGKLEVWVR